MLKAMGPAVFSCLATPEEGGEQWLRAELFYVILGPSKFNTH